MIQNTKKSRVRSWVSHTSPWQCHSLSRVRKHAPSWVAVVGEHVAMVRQVDVTLAVAGATHRCGEGLNRDNGIYLLCYQIPLKLKESQPLPLKLTVTIVGHRQQSPVSHQSRFPELKFNDFTFQFQLKHKLRPRELPKLKFEPMKLGSVSDSKEVSWSPLPDFGKYENRVHACQTG